MSTFIKNILALFGLIAVAFIAAILIVIAGNTLNTERGVQSAKIIRIETGWKRLVSLPVSIDETNEATGIIMASFEDRKSNRCPIAFTFTHSFPTAKSPGPRTGNKWLIGDEVYVIPVYALNEIYVGGPMLPSDTFFILDWRRNTNSVKTTQ